MSSPSCGREASGAKVSPLCSQTLPQFICLSFLIARYSTPARVLAETIVRKTLSVNTPRNLAAGYRATAAVLSFYLPTFLKEWFWGAQFGTAKVGKADNPSRSTK